MLLDRFKDSKLSEIHALEDLEKQGQLPSPLTGTRPDFREAILRKPKQGPLAVIAEFKQASPSKGIIATGLTPEGVAQDYADGGATCISVLTQKDHFGGEIGYLNRMATPGLPLLRKDFIFHPLQVVATAATPASALLLIVRLTPDVALLRDLREQAESYGIHAVVEIFDRHDLELARQSGAKIIQVNARDLNTLHTDRSLCLELGREKQDGEAWIAASAMEKPEHLVAAQQAGFNAALIGTALMQHGTPRQTLIELLRSFNS
jgi:indole-3-glycerol phosphate synthase